MQRDQRCLGPEREAEIPLALVQLDQFAAGVRQRDDAEPLGRRQHADDPGTEAHSILRQLQAAGLAVGQPPVRQASLAQGHLDYVTGEPLRLVAERRPLAVPGTVWQRAWE